MGTALESCCQSKTTPDPLQSKKGNAGNKKMKKLAQDATSVPDSSKTNGQATDDQNLNDKNNSTENLSDEHIEKILDKRAKIKKKIEFQDFQIDGKLGEGGFGVVYLGQLKSNIAQGKIQKYAIKKVSKQLLIKKKVYANALDEKNILAMYDCKFIVALVMAFQDPFFIYFVMECAVGGDTYSLIKKNSPKVPDFKALGQTAVRFIAACVILGLQFLHKNDYMYRDLKPENVLLFEDGYAKLTDFGLAKKSLEGQYSKTISGTQFYYAPEMVLKKGYNKQIDLWTLGVYLYQLSNFEPPFTTQQITRARFQAVCLEAQNNMNWKNPNLSPQLKNIIQSFLRFDEKKRLGAKGWAQVKGHDFFKNFDWKMLEQQKMESPLKQIVSKYPASLKPYKPQPPRPTNLPQQAKVQGWTYYKDNPTINPGNQK